MTAKDAAALLGVSRTSLQRLINEQRLTPINEPHSPVITRHRRLLFRRADVERVLAEPPVPRKPRKKRDTTTYEVTVLTPRAVADVERLLRDPAPRPD